MNCRKIIKLKGKLKIKDQLNNKYGYIDFYGYKTTNLYCKLLIRLKKPIVIIGGTCQVIQNWIHIIEMIKNQYDVFIYETRGQVFIIYIK